MSIRLSHTSKELYLRSPRAFFYHYYLYLRERKLKSAFFFGSLIETGLNALFEGATLEQALETFRKNFKRYKVNGIEVSLDSSPLVNYTKADFDPDVFTEKELKDLDGKNQQFKSWASLQRKGEMLITAYYHDIFPKIKKVIAIQPECFLPNPSGDEIHVKADMICEWEDGRLIIPDHKTTTIKYAKDAYATEEHGKQTALYFEAFKDKYPLDATGFLVMEKKIRKNEPRARTDIILGKPPEELIDKTIEEFDMVLQEIKQGNFPCQSPNCDAYGQACCYKRYCKSGGNDMTGLIKYGKFR